MKKFWFMVILVLVISSTACNVLSGDGGETAASPSDNSSSAAAPSTDNNTDTSSATTNNNASEDFLSLDVSSLEPAGVNSYRFSAVYEVTGTAEGQSVSNRATVNGSRIINPPATTFSMSGEGANAAAGQTGIFTQIGTDLYVELPGAGCLSTGGQDTFHDTYANMLNASGALGQLQDAKRVLPNETINGVETKVYAFDQTTLASVAGAYSSVNGRIYLAADGGYPVRVTMTATGSNSFSGGGEATLNYELNFSDFNGNFEINVPAECATQAAGGDYPVMADAFEMTTLSGTTIYKTNASVEDVVAFYKAELSAWTVGQETAVGPTATVMFNKDGANLMLTIAPDPSSGATIVSLIGQ